MHLSPQEKDKLLIVTAALLAERRLKRGVKLNHPEAMAWLSFLVLEGARDGQTVAELMQAGTTWLRRDQVMEGVPELVEEVQIEAVFPDGTKLPATLNSTLAGPLPPSAWPTVATAPFKWVHTFTSLKRMPPCNSIAMQPADNGSTSQPVPQSALSPATIAT